MTPYMLWFVFALILAGAEMLTGTFYLLVYGGAAAVGGLAALAGLGTVPQLVAAALCAVAGTVWLRRHPISRKAAGSQSLDLGQRVEVEQWKSETVLRVRYRGTGWDAELAGPPAAPPERPATLYIVGQRGNTLLLSSLPPA